MNKTKRSSWILSAIVVVIGAVVLLTKVGMKLDPAASAAVDYSQLLFCSLAAVVLALFYGFLRFDRANAIALSAAVLHDLLVTMALVVLLSAVLPRIAAVPAATTLAVTVLLSVAFTFCQSIPILRAARHIVRTTSRRDVSLDDAAKMAVAETRSFRVTVSLPVLLLVVAAVVAGGIQMLSVLIALPVALAVSHFSAELITPTLWAGSAAKLKPRKVYR